MMMLMEQASCLCFSRWRFFRDFVTQNFKLRIVPMSSIGLLELATQRWKLEILVWNQQVQYWTNVLRPATARTSIPTQVRGSLPPTWLLEAPTWMPIVHSLLAIIFKQSFHYLPIISLLRILPLTQDPYARVRMYEKTRSNNRTSNMQPPPSSMELPSSSPTGHAASADTACVSKIQALFRGRRCRLLHVDRVRRNLPWSPFVPAKTEAVDAMLALARLRPNDTLLDIGSGDGRVLLAAASLSIPLKAVLGVEIDGALVATSRRNIQQLATSNKCVPASKIQVIHADWLDVDMRDVDVVILFFLPHDDIASILQTKLRAGTRVITYVFQIKQWVPEAVTSTVPFMTDKGSSCIYRYIVPPTQQQHPAQASPVQTASSHATTSA